MRLRLFFRNLAFIVITVFSLYGCAASGAEITVDAEGLAAVVDGNMTRAREEAKRQLYRDALEKGIGAYVQGITEMKDFEVVRDRVFSQSQGLVTSVKNSSERVDSDGILHLTATCTVSEKKLDGLLGPAVIDMLGNPRIMVLVDEVVEGERQFLSTSEGEVLRAFQKAGYLVVDAGQAGVIKEGELEAAKVSGDPAKLQEVARSFQADVLIHGKAQGNSFTKQKIEGITLFGVRSQLQLKAIIAQNAFIIGTELAEKKTKGTSPGDGAVKGFTDLAPKMAGELVNKVAYALVSGSSGGIPGRTYRVSVSGVAFAEARTLRDALGQAGGISGVYQRSFADRTLEMDVVTEKTAEDVAVLLESLGVEVTGLTAGTVEGRKGP